MINYTLPTHLPMYMYTYTQTYTYIYIYNILHILHNILLERLIMSYNI